MVVVLPQRRRRPAAAHQLQRRHRGERRHRVGCNLIDADQVRPRSAARTSASAADVDRRGRATGARRGRRAGHPPAAARHDARLLERSRALPRDLLVAHPRHVGARRLGADRRGRLLVHPGPIGRHAQGGRQARRPGGGRERRGRPIRPSWRRPRSASRTRSRARSSCVFCVLAAARPTTRTLRRSISDKVVEQMGKPLQARGGVRRAAICPGHAAARSCAASPAPHISAADPGDLSALENPAAVEAIRERPAAGRG